MASSKSIVRAAMLVVATVAASACTTREQGRAMTGASAVVVETTPIVTPLLPVLLARAALDVLPPDSEKRPGIEQIRARIVSDTGNVREARASLLETLAAGLESEVIHQDDVDAEIREVERSVRASSAGLARGSGELFRTLTQPERQEVARHAERRWPDWQARWRVLDENEAANRWEARGALRAIADRVHLSTEQVQAARERLGGLPVSAETPSEDARRAAYRAAVTAFAGDSADAFVASIVESTATAARASAARVAQLVASVLPELSADQRVALAEFLRERETLLE